MQIPTKRFNKNTPLPQYEDGAAGFDFICSEDSEIDAGETKAIPGNLAMAIPEGYVLMIVPRSSTPARFWLSMPHSVGIIDPFYCGDDNQIMLVFHNFSNEKAVIKKGKRIAQGILIKYEKVEFQEVEKLGESTVKTWHKNERCRD